MAPFNPSVIHIDTDSDNRRRPLSIKQTTPLLETVFFNFQTNRERKIENKKFGDHKKVSSVFTQYVCLCVCVYMCVCVFVCLLALYRRHRLT